MRIAVIYINAGKGHFIPSVAICEALNKKGHVAKAFDGFKDVFNRADVAQVAEKWWRTMLHMPKVERPLEYLLDRIPYVSKKSYKIAQKTTDDFIKWIDDFKPDVILTTQYSCSYIFPQMVKDLNLPICSLVYSPDTYVTPLQTVNDNTYRYFIASDEGRDLLIKQGKVPPEKVLRCAFPLRSDCYYHEPFSKQKARAKLKLNDKFTVMINLGGEGIASTAIVDELAKRGTDIQILIIGTLHDETRAHYEELMKKYPGLNITMPGYVTDMNLWLYACDMLVGKAGPNAMTEALYCRRPYMVTSLLYMSSRVVAYFEKYKVGWYAPSIKKQVEIITECKENPNFLPEMEANFDNVPMIFGADKLADQLIDVANEYFENHKK